MTFSLDTDACLRKINERGVQINWHLIKELREQLSCSSAGDAEMSDKYSKDHLTELFETSSLGNICGTSDMQSCLVHYLSELHVLEQHDISGINVSVLLSSLRPRCIRNLYRHLYLQWQPAAVYFKQLDTPMFSFTHTPSQFNNITSAEDMLREWYAFVGSFVRCGKPYALFFVNHLHSYMLPFE